MNKPERIHNVSDTQFSIARHYGGISLNGAEYHYDAENDTLIRMDIWKAQITKNKKDAREKLSKTQDSFF